MILQNDVRATAAFRARRDHLLFHRADLVAARSQPRAVERLTHFNWAFDWFDDVAARNNASALIVVGESSTTSRSYAQLAHDSSRCAAWLRDAGMRAGDRVMLVLDNCPELWQIILAGIRLGAVLVPSSTELSPHDLAERMARVDAAAVICGAAQTAAVDAMRARHRPGLLRIAVCGEQSCPGGWLDARECAAASTDFERTSRTRADELLFLYFTSGTTSRPKIVAHTHTSYPVGHLSGMYWNGLRPGDRHLNVSAPGWAKHVWSSLFVPCAAEATIVALAARAPAPGLVLRTLAEQGVDSFCAPPSMWRRLVQEDLARHPVAVREATSAGEPLAAEIVATVKRAWNVRVRDGYGQTETTAQVGVTPGSTAPPGSMGRALPGYSIALLDTSSGRPGRQGEIAVRVAQRPIGLTAGYLDDAGRAIAPERDGWYRTGDLARADADGYLHYLGRRDDVFKCGGHRVSPLEVERAVLSHPHVAEAAVTPFPDPTLTAVPKAFVRLVPRAPADAATALDVLRHAGELLAPHCAPRRIEFGELPSTSTGKVRRAELRRRDADRDPATVVDGEFVTSGVEAQPATAHLSLSTTRERS